MEWGHAGRPRTRLDTDVPEQKQAATEDEFWTAEEKSIIAATENQSVVMLALAVVKQWVLDGKPKRDAENIKAWVQVIKEHI